MSYSFSRRSTSQGRAGRPSRLEPRPRDGEAFVVSVNELAAHVAVLGGRHVGQASRANAGVLPRWLKRNAVVRA